MTCPGIDVYFHCQIWFKLVVGGWGPTICSVPIFGWREQCIVGALCSNRPWLFIRVLCSLFSLQPVFGQLLPDSLQQQCASSFGFFHWSDLHVAQTLRASTITDFDTKLQFHLDRFRYCHHLAATDPGISLHSRGPFNSVLVSLFNSSFLCFSELDSS